MKTQIAWARNVFRVLSLKMVLLASDDSGMSTVEYAIGTIGICRSPSLCKPRRMPGCDDSAFTRICR